MVGIPARAEQPLLFARMRDEENGARRSRSIGERLRDGEQRGGSCSVVVSAIKDGIATWRTDPSQAVDIDADRRRARSRIPRGGPVEVVLGQEDVVRANRIVIEAERANANVVVVRADRDVLIPAIRVAPRQNGDDVAGKNLFWREIPHLSAERTMRDRPDGEMIDRLAEQRRGGRRANLQRQGWCG